MSANVNVIRNLLVRGMTGVAAANAKQVAVQEERSGAYVLFTEAARMCEESPTDFIAVTDTLFEELRVSSTITDSEGNAHSVTCKAGKDGKGFVVPSSFSTAKSILTEALQRKLPFYGDDGERSYTSLRKEVSALKEAEKRAAATGDDRIRYELHEMLAEMTGKVDDLKGPELADLYRRVHRAAVPKPVSVKTEGAKGADQATELAQAA